MQDLINLELWRNILDFSGVKTSLVKSLTLLIISAVDITVLTYVAVKWFTVLAIVDVYLYSRQTDSFRFVPRLSHIT